MPNTQRTRKTNNRNENANNVEALVSEQTEEKASVRRKPIIPKDIDASQFVTVRNGFQGKLVYVSKRTGETFIWGEFGSEQEMELRELRNAKNSYKTFFVNNWFMFDEDWIVDYLGVRQYYRHALPIDGFDDVFKQKPAELKKTINTLSEGQKRSVAYRAKELISEHKIDSLSVITTLEKALNIELIEK